MKKTPLEQVLLRNAFYRDNYRRLILLLFLSIIVIAVLLFTNVYLINNRPSPKYFATDTNYRVMRLQPLSVPGVETETLLAWATQAATDIYTYNYLNYRESLQELYPRFTESGWRKFINTFNNSGNLDTVKSQKLLVQAKPLGAPIIENEGVLASGRYAWRIKIPLQVIFENLQRRSLQRLELTITVVRVSMLQNSKGIGIEQVVSLEK